jgi:glyoxylate reductase
MSDILIASELRDLIGQDPVPGRAVRWLQASEPVPEGYYDAIIPLLSRWIGGTEFKNLKGLRVVANCATGVDNIDLVAAELNRVIVTNTPGILTESTADLTWALLLAVARRLKEGLQLVASGEWKGWHPTLLLGEEMAGKTLGILGAGRIGQAVGRRAVAFGMRILYTARTRKADWEQATGALRTDLSTVLGQCDVLTIHLPATPETRGLMNRERFALLKRGALLINTSRGETVREPAMLEALEQGILAGAGLDVFPDEPRVNAELIAHPRVVTLPHLGSATRETRRAMADLAVANVRAVLAGEKPLTPVLVPR